MGAREPYAPYLDGFSPWNFAGPAQTARRLAAAGFRDVRTALAESPPPYDDLGVWLAVNALGAHQLRLPEELRERYVGEVHSELAAAGAFTYIRLNIDATA